MATINQKLFKGELEGVEFFFKELTESGGRKNIFHKFINSDVVRGEDLGGDSKGFGLDIYIAGTGSTIEEINDNYSERKGAILSVLNRYGALKMVHPTRGLLNVMQSSNYQITETVGSLNKCNISASFIEVDNTPVSGSSFSFVKLEGDLRIFELSSGGVTTSRGDGKTLDTDEGFNIQDVSNLRNNVFDRCGWTINEVLADFDIIADYVKSSEAILQNIAEVQDLMEVSLQAISGTKNLSDVFRQIESLSFLNTGSKLGQIGLQIGKIFVAVENSIEDSKQRYNFFKAFFDYNDNYQDKQVLSATSLPNIETEQNEIYFRNYLQVLGASYSCNAIADYDFETENTLNKTSSEINNQFLKMLDYYQDNTEIYNLLQRQRVVINEQIERSRLTVKRIITIDVVNSSLTNICYTYYESLDLFSDIQSLNNFNNPSNITGEVKIFSSGVI